MDLSKLLRASNDGKVELNTSPLHTAEHVTVILASDWLCLSRHGIKYFIPCLENTANQRPRLPLHILRYATGICNYGAPEGTRKLKISNGSTAQTIKF